MANKPNNPALWSKAKSLAKQKFDVYPSAYANGWAAKYYKSKGGTWRKAAYGMEVPVMAAGGKPNNPGFNALPEFVQAKILANMGYGGMTRPYMQKGGEPDGEMALGQIAAVVDKMDKLRQFIQPGSDLEPWISSKLAVMDHYADAVSDYMMYNPEAQEGMMEEEGLPMEEMKMGGIPERYKNMGFNKVGVKKNSTRPGKKWMVLAKKGDQYKVVHGGYDGMKDFSQHGSEKRKENFWNRMGGKNSSKATDPFSPLYWHKRFGTWQEGGEIEMPEMKGGGSTWSGNAWYNMGGYVPEYGMGGMPCYECGGMYADGGGYEIGSEKDPSIVNYLASRGDGFAYADRAKLAKEFGIEDYKGTASQNLKLLKFLRKAEQVGATDVPCIPGPDGQCMDPEMVGSQVFNPIIRTDSVVAKQDSIPVSRPTRSNYVQVEDEDDMGMLPYAVGAAGAGTLGYMGYRAGLQPSLQGLSPMASRINFPAVESFYQVNMTPEQTRQMNKARKAAIKEHLIKEGMIEPKAKAMTKAQKNKIVNEAMEQASSYWDDAVRFGQKVGSKLLRRRFQEGGEDNAAQRAYNYMDQNNILDHIWNASMIGSSPAEKAIWQSKYGKRNPMNQNPVMETVADMGQYFIPYYGTGLIGAQLATAMGSNNMSGEDKAVEGAAAALPYGVGKVVGKGIKAAKNMFKEEGGEMEAPDPGYGRSRRGRFIKPVRQWTGRNDSKLEDIIEFIDPTGITSWDDAAEAIRNIGNGKKKGFGKAVATVASIASALPKMRVLMGVKPMEYTSMPKWAQTVNNIRGNLGFGPNIFRMLEKNLMPGAKVLGPYDQGSPSLTYKKGGIYIDPAKKGTFKAQATRMGMSTQEAAAHILANKEDYSPAMVKKANFARNFAKQDGGPVVGQEMEVSPEQLEELRRMGYEFEIV
jgi:hypothetical protein